uniref:SUMO specific peptidase 3b n=1 Tax=Seriola dumerili TaxID=41447 RepID=A0A3B4TKI5_SERDU
MRDSGGSLAQNCWQGDLGLTAVGQDDTGGGGIPGDHLIVPVSGHSVPSSMHLRLGQKEKVWTREYVDKEEDDGMGGIEAIGDDDDEEENNLDGEDKGEFSGKDWDNNEEEDEDEEEEEEEVEEEGDQAEVEWEIPDFPFQSTHQPHSQPHPHYGPQQKAEDGGDVTVEDSLSQAEAGDLFRSHLSRYRALRRLRRWQRLRSHGGLGFRLTQHWKSWRQRAQWVCFLGHRWSRRGQRYNLYGKQRRIKRYQQSPYTDGEDDSTDERFTESDRDKKINGCPPEKQEDRGRREVDVKPVELSLTLTEEHMSCVTGILEESLQQYGSLIPIHVDDIVEKLQDIFSESFSQPHRKAVVQHLIQSFQRSSGSALAKTFRVNYKRHVLTMDDLGTLYGQNWLNDQIMNMYGDLVMDSVPERVHFFNSFFYDKLRTKGYEGVKRWTKNSHPHSRQDSRRLSPSTGHSFSFMSISLNDFTKNIENESVHLPLVWVTVATGSTAQLSLSPASSSLFLGSPEVLDGPWVCLSVNLHRRATSVRKRQIHTVHAPPPAPNPCEETGCCDISAVYVKSSFLSP